MLGEFALIEKFRKMCRRDSGVIVGSGDDCAVLRFDKKFYQLYTCDMIVEGVDFTAKDDPGLIGRKALAVSLSDIAACGGIPRYAVVSMGLPAKWIKKAEKIAGGLFRLAKDYGVNIVGGDLSRANRLVLDVSMLGIVEKNKLVLRSGAKVGDVVFVTGSLGRSIAGKHLRFVPRVKEARFLVKNFKITSMIDISDGIAQDLGHILKASNVGARIYKDALPLSREARNFEEALYGGEEFELLFTVPRNQCRYLAFRKNNLFKPIGEIVRKGIGFKLVGNNGREKVLKPEGWRHF
jgi:thiamine-monophosphate kinase